MDIKMINNKKQKNIKKEKDKDKEKQKKTLDIHIKNIRRNILKLIKSRYNNNTCRYVNNYDNFDTDFKILLNSPIVSIIQINNIISSICKSHFFGKLMRKYTIDNFENMKNKNKEFIENIINNHNQDLFEQIMYEYEEQSDIDARNKITEHIIDIVKNIYDKFKKISDKIVYDFIKISYIYNNDNFINYLNEINYKTRNNNICELIYKDIPVDCFLILEEINLEKMLKSKYITNIQYHDLTKLIKKYGFDNKINIITDLLLDILVNTKFYTYDDVQIKYNNIINWIIENYSKNNNLSSNNLLTSKQKLKLLGYLNLLIFIHIYYTYDFVENNIDIFITNLNTLLQNEYNRIILQLQKEKIFNHTDIFNLIDFIEIQNIIEEKYYYYMIYRSTDIKIDFTNEKIWILDDDKIYICKYNKICGKDIKIITKKVFFNFINLIKDKITKEKNIKNIYNLNILNYDNHTFTYDEKLEFFKKIYSGKITTKDIESFILYHNQIANFLIQKINITEDMIKLSFNSGNINFIEKLIDIKYPITLTHLTYLQNCNEKQVYELLKYLNKYNALNYLENFDWYYHLKNMLPNIDIPEIIYNDDNIELRNEFLIKIKELDEKNIFNKLNNMDYINFINYYRTSTDKIKLSFSDIIKFTDYNKRQYILNNIKIC
jgi:hypothetical protein